jgi:hypothetical protein
MPKRDLPSVARAAVALTTLVLAVGCGKSEASSGDGNKVALSLRAADGGGDARATTARPSHPDDSALPSAESEELTARMRHLVEALAHQNPDLARDVLFPRDAYLALRDVQDPANGWDKRVSTPFRSAIERTHKRTPGIEHAKFVSFEIGSTIVQVQPKKKDWKKPLWTVKRSRITFVVDKKPHTLEIAEMTAWRGAWYVTRLR